MRVFWNAIKFFLLLVSVAGVAESKPKRSLEIKERFRWTDVCKKNKSAIVQIFSYRNHYDIFEPFRAPEQSAVSGSGVIITDNGYVLTNFHVVESTVGIYAQTALTGKERFKLDYIGGCPQRDVALLRFSSDAMDLYKKMTNYSLLPEVVLGDSDKIVEAEEIMLLGHPGSEEEVKITVGYVKGRTSSAGGSLVQTTAPVNHGDSGGPFFNVYGEVIGLCVAKKIDSECFGYIIPINNITFMFDDLMNNKILRLPRWGIGLIPTTPSTRSFLRCSEEGVYLAEVLPNYTAAEAGLRRGDIITSINGKKIDQSGYLSVDWTEEKVNITDYFNRIPLGSTVEVQYYREGFKKNVTMKLVTRKVDPVDYFYSSFEKEPEFEIFAGMVVSQLSLNHVFAMGQAALLEKSLMKYAHDENDLEPRLLITSVFNTSQLHLARVFGQRPCLLDKINGQRVTTISAFRSAILGGKDSEFLTIEAEGGAFVALPLQEVLNEEDRLSSLYCYKQSSLVDLLKK